MTISLEEIHELRRCLDLKYFMKKYFDMDAPEIVASLVQNWTKDTTQAYILHQLIFQQCQTIVVLAENQTQAKGYLKEIRDKLSSLEICKPKTIHNNLHMLYLDNGSQIVVGDNVRMIQGRSLTLLHLYGTEISENMYYAVQVGGMIIRTSAEGNAVENHITP